MMVSHQKERHQRFVYTAAITLVLCLAGLLGVSYAPTAGAEPEDRRPSRLGPPQNVTATPGDGQVAISWEAPARTKRSPKVTGYEVTAISVSVLQTVSTDDRRPDQRPRTCTASADERNCTVRNLRNGELYRFFVVAKQGRFSTESASVEATPMRPRVRTIIVKAKGERAEEKFIVKIGDTQVGDETQTTTDYQSYEFKADGDLVGPVSVEFTNDYYDGYLVDRNLWVDYLSITNLPTKNDGPKKVVELSEYDEGIGTDPYAKHGKHKPLVIQSDSQSVYSEGAWNTGQGCSPTYERSDERITCGGRFIYVDIDTNGRLVDGKVGDPYLPEETTPEEVEPVHEVRVRARGEMGGERFAVRIGPDVLGHIVVSRQWRTYRFPMQTDPSGKLVVAFMNDMDDSYNDFNLEIDWASYDGTKYESEHPGVYTATSGGCTSGHLQSQVLYCNGANFYTDI